MGRKWIAVLCCVLALCMVAPLLVGCGSKKETGTRTVVIGDLTDLTGAAANAMTPISYSLSDYVGYVNEHNLIPNVKLSIVQYDTQYKSDRFLLGYQSVKEQGAQVIFTGFPGVAEALNTQAQIDGIPIIECSATDTVVDNPGAVFCLASLPRSLVPAELEWVYKNDWKGTGPAKIAFVSWNIPPDPDILKAVKAYCESNTSQYTFKGSSMAPAPTMTWSSQVTEFKDCDYIFFGSGGAVAPATFIAQFRAAGGTAKILATDTLVSYISAIVDQAGGWSAVDGMLNAVNYGWWNMDSDQMRLAIELLRQNHPSEASAIMAGQCASGVIDSEMAVELIKAAIEKIGNKEITSKAIMEALPKVKVTLPGFPTLEYSSSREGLRYFQMWKCSAADKDLVLASDWVECK